MKRKLSYEELQKRVRLLEKETEELGQIKVKLEESEARFRDIADNALEWIWQVDTTGKYTYSSPVVKKILGYEPEEVLGNFFFDFFHPDEKKRLMKATYKAFEYKRSFRKFINRNVCKDGKTVVVLSTSGVPLFDAEGNFMGYRGADMDITDQYIAEKKLRVSEEHLRSLMESASGFAVYRLVYDKESPHSLKVIFVSPSINDIFGIPDPMKFESWFENIHPDDVSRLTEANKRAFETKRFNEEFRTYNEKKGEWRWVHAISTGGTNKNGWNRYVNGILIDITGRKASEEALKSKEKELETRASKLEELNVALNVLLEKRKTDQSELEEKIILNVESLIKPYLDKLRHGNLDERKKNILNIIQTNLDEIISPFTRYLSSIHYNLTPKEIQIANFIRQGITNKEIAEILFLSIKTVEFHRDNIRKKLGIRNKKINLASFLLSID
jgi:PAS domain S-box-containing protein